MDSIFNFFFLLESIPQVLRAGIYESMDLVKQSTYKELNSRDNRRRQELDFWAETSFPMLIVSSTDISEYSVVK
jgi:hypothetical protein